MKDIFSAVFGKIKFYKTFNFNNIKHIKHNLIKMPKQLIEVDGSVLEGGGQIIRIAISLSALTSTPIKIYNIRKNRSKGGLSEQHLKGIELAAKLCNAEVTGAEIRSMEVTFKPRTRIRGGDYACSMRTAGSIALLFQIGLPCAIFADSPVTLRITGGTNAPIAPPIDYTSLVFSRIVQKFGVHFSCNLIKRGYFPKGGGQVDFTIQPVRELNAVQITTPPGDIRKIQGICIVSQRLGKNAVKEIEAAARREINFTKQFEIDEFVDERLKQHFAGLVLYGESETGCLLSGSSLTSSISERASDIGGDAAKDFLRSIQQNGCVDHYTQDQLIIFMALAPGKSVIRTGEITMHTKTAIHVVELLTEAKFNITQDNNSNIIECNGIALRNNEISS